MGKHFCLHTFRFNNEPLVNESASRYTVSVQGLWLSKDTLNTPILDQGQTLTVDIDSGAPLSVFPSRIAQKIIQAFPDAKKNDGETVYSVPCTAQSLPGSLDFKFGDVTVKHTFRDFVVQEGEEGEDGPGCILGFMEEDTNVVKQQCKLPAANPRGHDPAQQLLTNLIVKPILGVPFLRSAYVVFDQDNFEVHIANSANCGTNLVAIGKGAEAVPQVSGECKALT